MSAEKKIEADSLYVRPAWKDNLVHLLRLSVETKENDFFKTFFVWQPNKDGSPYGDIFDVCDGGSKSCALFVSRILLWVGLARRSCTTVNSLVSEICNFGWYPVAVENTKDNFKTGTILIWEPRLGSGGQVHKHAGFYLVRGLCVSNDPRLPEEGGTLRPIEHNLFMDDILPKKRRISAAYYHPYLHLEPYP